MSEGRHELEQAIEVWENRHAEAVRLKREAEVVMPFLRAAVEELDNFRGEKAVAAPAETIEAPATPAEPVPAAPNPFDGNFGGPLNEATEPESAEVEEAAEDQVQEPVADFPGFQPRAISALMDEEADDEAAVG